MSDTAIRVTICGSAGRMGKANVEVFSTDSDTIVVGAIETQGCPLLGQDAGSVAGLGTLGVPLTDSLQDVLENTDVVIDFTNPAASLKHIQLARAHVKAVVVGTTGFSDQELEKIREQAQYIPIVQSPNMSLGVNTLFHLVGQAATILGEDFDAEIVEIHHNLKKDAPSGTALQFGRVISEARGKNLKELGVYGREGLVGERKKDEIGIMAIRLADVVGDHCIIFGGAGERIEFIHRNSSRKTYARGALRAAKFVVGKKQGFYTMADVLGLK